MSEDKRGTTLSHARTVDLPGPPNAGAKLDLASQNVSSQFDRARAAQAEQQKATQPQQTTAKEQVKNSPNMSHAKTLDVGQSNDKLGQASQNVRDQFARAQAARQQEAQQTERRGPAPAPGGMDYKPDNANGIRRAVDGQEHNKQLADYDNYAKQLNNSANVRKEPKNSLELKNERGQDNDGRGR